MAEGMSRAGYRGHVVATRLSDTEVAWLDAARGSLSRSEYVRWVLLRAKRASEAPR